MEQRPLFHRPVVSMATAWIQPSNYVKLWPSCSKIAAGAWTAWTAVGCLLACFVRAMTANAKNEMSIKDLGWSGGLLSSSDGQKELGCV